MALRASLDRVSRTLGGAALAHVAAASAAIVIATVNNAPVTIADVATVGEGIAPNYTIVTADGHPAVLLNVTLATESPL